MALLPPHYSHAIVSIETESKDTLGIPFKASIATGFLVGKPLGTKNDKGESLYNFYVVTNRHVFQNLNSKVFLQEVFFRFNTVDNKSHYFKVELLKPDGSPQWYKHANENIDLAVLPINSTAIIDAKISYYIFHDQDIIYARDFAAKHISAGDGLFVLGFPIRLNGKARNFVIVRQGIIARVDEEVLSDGYYYIDAAAYPGNSGGPVIIKPEIVAVGGTQSNNSAGLIGVISSGESYSDVAVSQQTGEARIIFKEQIGLIRVVPIEYIFEIIDAIPKAEENEKAKVEDAGTETNGDKKEMQNMPQEKSTEQNDG